MSQNLPATSANSQIQSQKPKSLLEYTETKEEIQIVKCIQESIMIQKLQELTPLINVVAKWRMYVGLPKTDVSEELSLVADFLYKEYGYLTVNEIELAYTLSVTNRLREAEFFGYFSPLYVGKVLDAYLYYRKITMADTIRRRDRAMQEAKELANKPTQEQQAKQMKELFKEMYDRYKSQGEIYDPFSITYNFLRRAKLYTPTKEEIEEAVKWGKEKVQEIKREKYAFVKYNLNQEEEEKRWSRTWCVQKYFENVDISVLLNNIKPEFFT